MARGDLDAGAVAAALRPDGASPLHVQVEDGLRHRIRSGQVPVGAGLPGELDLAATLGMSRHTIRHALSTLSAEGLLRRERGRGTRVVAPLMPLQVRHLDRFYAFAWEMTAQGIEQRSHILERLTRVPPPAIAQRLKLATDVPVTRIVRVRMANEEPLVIETAYSQRNAFRIERTTWAGQKPIEWQESIVRGDRFLYSVELDRRDTQALSGARVS